MTKWVWGREYRVTWYRARKYSKRSAQYRARHARGVVR